MLNVKSIPLKEFNAYASARGDSGSVTTAELFSQLSKEYDDYRNRRSSLVDVWYDCYLQYLASNPLASQQSLASAQRLTGITGNNWRAKYVGSKGFDQVETVVSYCMGAMFPGNKYFGLQPSEPIDTPEWQTVLELVRKRLTESLKINKFSTSVEIFLREMCITGLAAVATPWLNGNTSLSVWSPFDIFLDPDAEDPNAANVIRTYSHTKGEYLAMKRNDFYRYGSNESGGGSGNFFSDDTYLSAIKALQGLDLDSLGRDGPSKVEVREFWGDLVLQDGTVLYNVVAQYTGTELLDIYSNEYGDKRPFVFCRYIPLAKTPYGLGILQPVLGQLSAINVLLNRRADSVTLQTDQAYTYIESGVVDPDMLDIAPGAMIPVTMMDAIKPLPTQSTNLQVSVTDQIMLEQAVDKSTGTGPYVGINAGRTQERVTATEVTAQKDAGGVRLSTRYSHINEEFFVPFLTLYLFLHQQYSEQVFYVRLDIPAGPGKYYAVPPSMLQLPMKVYTIGSGHLTDKEFTLRQFMQWFQVVSVNPAFAQQVNWPQALSIVTHLMLPDYAEQMLSAPPTPEAPMPGGGLPGVEMNDRQQQALQSTQAAGQLPAMAQDIGASLGLNPPSTSNLTTPM